MRRARTRRVRACRIASGPMTPGNLPAAPRAGATFVWGRATTSTPDAPGVSTPPRAGPLPGGLQRLRHISDPQGVAVARSMADLTSAKLQPLRCQIEPSAYSTRLIKTFS
jgi:hypothetical protein